MIPKEQLRIGNLVILAHESNAPIVEIEEIRRATVLITDPSDAHRYMSVNYDGLMPIGLTEEWLLKLGFIRRWNNSYRFEDGNVDIEKFDKGWVLLCEEMSNWSRYYNYVHEIQQLVQILTGKELTIKEPINE